MPPDGEGPFLWLGEKGPPDSFRTMPKGGLCLSAFLFVRDGDRVLLGRYADDPAWAKLAGLDETRRRVHGQGWTLPASHIQYGEDPRDAGRRIAREILGREDLRLSEPRVETEYDVPARFPELGNHFDVWFFLEARWPGGRPTPPPHYAALEFHDPRTLPKAAWARSHEDVAARWLRSSGKDM